MNKNNNLKDARKYTMKSIELNPKFALAYYSLGNILNKLNELDESLLSFQKAVQYNNDLHEAIAESGKVLLKQGKHLKGLKELKKGYGSIVFDYHLDQVTINKN